MNHGLRTRDVAEIIGVNVNTIMSWELNRYEPTIRYIPKIISFLGYIPFNAKDDSLAEKMKTYRMLNGLTQDQLAKKLVLMYRQSDLSNLEKESRFQKHG